MPLPSAVKAAQHRRGHARLRLGIEARLETLDGRLTVRLIDLSQSGAHVILPQPRRLSRAVLYWLEFEAFGYVAWQDGEHIGLAFDELVPMAQLYETRQRAPEVVQAEALSDKAAARDFVSGTFNPGG